MKAVVMHEYGGPEVLSVAEEPEEKPPTGHEVGGEDPLGQLDGIAQRHLKDAGAQLDGARHGGRHGQGHERVGTERAAAHGVEGPRALEAGGLDAPRRIGEAQSPKLRPARAAGGKRDPESGHIVRASP